MINTHALFTTAIPITAGLIFGRIIRKRFFRLFHPCQECRFTPSAVTQQDRATGAWHQIQECERCGQKRDVILPQQTVQAARQWFLSNQP